MQNKMNIKRVIVLIVTAPVWLFVGLVLVVVYIPLFFAVLMAGGIMYAFTGKWSP